MTMIKIPITAAGGEVPPRPGWRSRAWRKWRRQPAASASAAFLLLLVVVAIVGPRVMPFDPNQQSLENAFQGPSVAHIMGTDQFGRDVFSRLIDATQIAVVAPLTAVSVALLLGLTTGLMAGYRGGRIDWVFSRVSDTLLSIPPIVLAIAIIAVLGPDLRNAMVAVGLVYAPRLFRVVRGSVLTVREALFVESARSIGLSQTRTLYSHILPNVATPLLVQVTLMMGFALLAEASLSFLGLAVQPPDASWGSMLRTAYDNQFRAPFAIVPPGVAMTLTILAFNTLGDGLRDTLAGKKTR